MSKKLYILNPHRDDFIWEPLYFRFIKRRALKKYAYIGEEFEKNKNIELVFSNNSSGIIPQKILNVMPTFIRNLIITFEIKRWKKTNEIKRDIKINWLNSCADDVALHDIFFFQLSITPTVNKLAKHINMFKNAYVHLSHYYLHPKEISATYQTLNNLYFCGDSDVSNHPFFKKYFSWYNKSFILIPFFINDRFKINNNLINRTHKLITTGTFHNIEFYPHAEYIKADFGIDAFHYNRRNFFENKDNYNETLVCYNSPWKESSKNWFKKWVMSKKVAQKSYFSFDIVEEYNKYTHALVGEEVGGFLGIGTLEAMACGCLVIANPNSLIGVIDDESLYVKSTEYNILSNFEAIINNNLNSEEKMQLGSAYVRTHYSKAKALSKFINTFNL